MGTLDYFAIGSRIRAQREFLGYTREYLAENISVSTNFCRDIEIGAKGMSLQTLYNISRVLKISVDYILTGEEYDAEVEPLLVMIKSCNPEKLKYAEDILKSFFLAID